MRILLVGAGGVGDASRRSPPAAIFRDDDRQRLRPDPRRTNRRMARNKTWSAGRTVRAARVDASDPDSVAALAREHSVTHVMNAVEPKFVPTVFAGALAAGANYLDMAMSLSEPHPLRPHEQTGIKLGDDQFAQSGDWESAGLLALVGMGVEPGLSDVFARYAPTTCSLG